MTNEVLIGRLYDIIDEVTRLGGEQERTSIVPGILVADANPSDLPTGYIKIVNPRDGTYVPCLTVNGLVVSDNDLVNVLFTKGTEPIALSQSAGSPSSSIKVSELWDSNFGAVAWQTDASGHLSNDGGERIFIRDSTPTTRIRLDPGTPSTDSLINIYNQSGTLRYSFLSSGDILGYDNLAALRVLIDTGSGTLESTFTLGDENEVAKIILKSGLSTGNPVAGIGTSTIPHGGIGAAMLALDGANASTAGPHIQVTTATDDYPLWQFLAFQHDSVQLSFDAYYDGAWKSSDAGSNARIVKDADKLGFHYDSGIAQGSAVTWNEGFTMDLATGNIGIGINAPEKRLSIVLGSAGGILSSDVVTDATTKDTRFLLRHYNNSEEAIACFGGASLSASTEARFGGGYGVQNAVTRLRFFTAANNTTLTGSERMTIDESGNVGINIATISAKLHVDQPSATAAIPVLYLDQADVSEEMIEFNTTIGTGNAIEAVGAKTLTTTHFIKVTLPGGLTRYIPVGTIA